MGGQIIPLEKVHDLVQKKIKDKKIKQLGIRCMNIMMNVKTSM